MSHKFKTIAKIIRYQLGVDETKKVKYDPWTKRGAYMNPTKESGRRQPALSYKRFAMKYERALDSRMKYFKKKGLCYVGWSMHPSWDKNIIEEERIVNEAIEGFKWLNGKPKYQIGKTLQERLLNTNLREMDPEAEAKKPINIVKDTSRRSSSSNHSQSSNRSRSRIQKRSSASSSITSGRLLITREDRMVLKREKDVMNMHVEKRKECPFLPIIFCWDQMEPSTGYPQLKVETEKDMCGISKKE